MTRLFRYLSANLPAIHWRQEALLLGLLLAVAVVFQWQGGAYRNEFGGHPDEPAHYVTGLMIRDYLASGFHSGPMTYATEYYDHYPKVALGNWPPVFYLIQSAWTLPFSPHRCSVLLLMAVLSALTAWVLFLALQRELGRNAGLFGSFLFLSLPLVRAHTGMVMTEIPVTLLAFTAVLFLARFLEQERTLDSLLFGLFASLAILTKGSGLFLALVVPLAVLLTRKFQLLRRPAFWYPAVVVVILCGPWTWKFREVARAGWMEDNPSWHFTQLAVLYYPKKLVLAVGVLLAILTLLGLVIRLFRSRDGKSVTGLWASAGALLVSVPIFHSIVPAGLEPRHLIPVLPAVVMFSLAGALEVIASLKSRGLTTQLATAATFGVLTLGFAGETYRPSPKGYAGLGPVAETLLNDPANAKAVFLISSDATGEGIFISEIAMRERRPGHVIRRASKVLASSSWSGSGYKARFEGEEALIKFLEQEPIEVLVLDESIPAGRRVAHHDLLRRTVEHHPARFTLLQSHGMIRAGIEHLGTIHVYRFKPRQS